MESILLPLHLVFVGLWLGCVLTEVLFERALLGKGPEQELLLARLHRRVDCFVEMPVFLLVAATGGLLFSFAAPSSALNAKVGIALLAIAANVACVRLVVRRSAFAEAGNWEGFRHADHLQHKLGAVVLLGILLALGSGLYLRATA